MGYVVATANPAAEPLTLVQVKNYLRLDSHFTSDDSHISLLISAAREHAERLTGKALAQRTFRQVLDSFPYYTDSIQSQLAYPPSYYSLPRYSTTLWNYSQMIKLFYPPIISVERIRFVQSDGTVEELSQDTDFILDRICYPARIFPVPGQYWPAAYYTPNSVEIDFTAGYAAIGANPDTHDVAGGATGQQPDSIIPVAFPANLARILLALINFWYDHRDAPSPVELDEMLYAEACVDFQPTRG
jgi:hypothetical protein